MIATGDYYRGPELKDSPIWKFLGATMKAVISARGEWKEGDSPGVIVVWVVPGSLGEVSFSGQRTTLFSRKKKLLQLEAAVPQDVVDAGGSVEFVVASLRQACATAAEVFERKGRESFDLANADAVIEKVRTVLSGLDVPGKAADSIPES